MQFQWAMRNYYSVVMRTITVHTIHVGALENCSRLSNKYDKVVNRILMSNRGRGENHVNVTIIFTTIRTSKSTYYLLYDKSPSKTQSNYNSILNFVESFGFTN